MNKTAKITVIILLLAAVCVFAFMPSLLSSGELKGDENAANTTAKPSGDTPPATNATPPSSDTPESPAEEGATVTIGKNIWSRYKIIHTSKSGEADVANKLLSFIKEETDKTVLRATDTSSYVREYEILIGETNREESAELYSEGIGYMDCRIALKGNKIVLAGGNSEVLAEAADVLIALFKNGELTLPENYYYSNGYEYKTEGILIDGVSLSEYRLVYADGNGKTAAEFLARKIGETSGDIVEIIPDSEEKTGREIVLGQTNRGVIPGCKEYFSYRILPYNESLFLKGYDKYGLNNAAYALLNAAVAAGGSVSSSDLRISYELPDREEYIEDIDKLYMPWIAEWEPDPRMLDFELKVKAIEGATDRLISCSHRADGYYFPENSIEGIISYYKMGGDVVELDIQVTKDGVLILMHDYDLYRMTNANEFIGKTIDGVTFPNTYSVSAWTYEQISYLNLKERWGDGSVTPFKVGTLEEALKICKNRLFIIPDKTDIWRYTYNDNLTASKSNYLIDVMRETGNYNSIILAYGLDLEGALTAQKEIYEESGVKPYIMLRDDTASEKTYDSLLKKALENSFGIQVGGQFYPSNTQAITPAFQEWRDKIVLWGWTIHGSDNIDTWRMMYALGYRMIMNNEYLELVKYAATTCNFE